MAEAKKVLLVVGTLRKDGFNLQLAHEIENLLGERAEVSYLDYARLPYMNQDLEDPELPEVRAVRDAVRGADVMEEHEAGIALPGGSWASGKLELSDGQAAALEAQADAFLEFIA